MSLACEEVLKNYFKKEDVVIIAPLNWGLGHATRCMPIIRWLDEHVRQVIIASDGPALELLKSEFPNLITETLPNYHIAYRYENIMLNIWNAMPSIVNAVYKEKSIAEKLTQKYNATVILSDNRLGFRSGHVKNYYLTHQINILHPNKWISTVGTAIHQRIIQKYDVCFVPDFQGEKAICPALSSAKNIPAVYLGPISRIRQLDLPKQNDICVVLSGPEPQRTILESLLLVQLNGLKSYKIHFVRGTDKVDINPPPESHIVVENIANSLQIEKLLNTSNLLIARSGYTTLMDIIGLNIKAILIPTPGQTEQEYLAEAISHQPNFTKLQQNETKKLPEIILNLIKS